MRFLAVIAIVAPIIVLGYVVGHAPRPETAAQVAARQAVDSLTRARVDALERADIPAWAASLRSDGVVITADPGPALIGPAAAAAGVQKGFSATGEGITLEPQRIVTGATRRGRLAWAASPLDYRVRGGVDGPTTTLLHSVAWLVREGEWRVMVEHDARVADWVLLRAGAAARRFPEPAMLTAPEGRGAEHLARKFERWLPHFSDRRVDHEAIAVGPTGAVAVGDSAVKAMLGDWTARLGAPRITAGGLAALVPRGRAVGWVAANLEVRPPAWGGAILPLRFTCVYRETGEDGWTLVLAHLSVAMHGGAIAGPPS
jgi:ketosteroid isomerase-like protein